MRQHLLALNEIQQIDLGIRDIERRAEAYPSGLKDQEAKIAAMRSELQKCVEQRDAVANESKTLDGSIQAETVKLKKWEARLVEIRNQREYLALSREVEGAKRQNRDWEEKITELNTQRDGFDKQIEVLRDKIAEAEVDCQAERDKVGKDVAQASDELGREKARRDALVSGVPSALFRKYEAIRAKRLGVGLVQVIDGKCQGCNMKLPPQLYNILQRVETVEQCPSCQRIVFWSRILPEGAAGAKDAAGATP